MKEILIDGKIFVPKGSVSNSFELAKPKGKLSYVIVRTCSAGVFAGYLKSREGKEVVLFNARRIWYWEGASSLSQLAMEGTKKPDKCKFPCEVSKVELTEAIEVLEVSKVAQTSIMGVPVWEN